MKFEQGDEIYSALVNTAGHELYVATENLKMFNRSVQLTKDVDDSVLLDAMSYQYYCEFIRSLYEFYVAIIQWNEKNTRLREYDFDLKMVEAVQRLLNFYAPVQRTLQPDFPKTAPPEFGEHFRTIRNRTAHADYRRMAPNLGSKDISLAEFFARYHFYCKLLVEHPQFVWGGSNFGKYTWAPVREFMQVVRKSDL